MAEFKRRRSKPLRFLAVPVPSDHPFWLDLDRQLPPDHLARRVRFLVEQLDLDSLLETYSGVGGPIHPPDLLLAFVLFETQSGRLSPAQWFTDSRDSIPARWLLRGLRPTRSVFYRFRDHLPAGLVDDLNRSVLLRAQAEGHTTAENGSLDGTYTAAYGSRHRLLTRNALAHRLHVLNDAIEAANAGDADSRVASCPVEQSKAAMAAPASPTAAATRLSGAAIGPVPSPDQAAAASQTTARSEGQLRTAGRPYWMARTASGRWRQRDRYQRAQRILQTRLSDHEQRQQGKSQRRRKSADKVVICPTDPEAVMGKDKRKVFRPLFNTQILQDVDSAFVLGYQVYAQVSDSGLLPPMLERTQQLTGRKVKTVRADGIYASLKDVRYCKENAVELYAPVERGSVGDKAAGGVQEPGKGGAAGRKGGRGKRKEKRFGKEQFPWDEARQSYRCPQGHLLQLGRIRKKAREPGEYVEVQEYRCGKEHCQQCPQAKQCTSHPEKGRTVERMVGQELLDEVAERMRTKEGKEEYQKRKQTVEPRHGDMRTHRGLEQFRGYGQRGAESQVGLLVLAQNGLALLTARKKRKAPQTSDPGTPAPTHRRQYAIPTLLDDKEWLSWN
jgi:transposase